MLFAKNLLLGASLIASAIAQTRIAFTRVPASVVPGETYTIEWAGGDGTSVTLTLRKGDPTDLGTVGTIDSGIEGDSYDWKVDEGLEDGDDYALQITQGQSAINYSGQFSVVNSTDAATTTSTNSTSAESTTTLATSLGTGTALPRNTTFSSATMTSTTSLEPGTTLHASTSTETETTTTPSATPESTNAPNSNAGVAQLGSSAALVMGVFAAVVFLS